jgi:lycopene beta-cyclase
MHFDYIIAGAGCAGLSLAYRMSNDSFFDDKKILLIDKEQKNKQDRTWCFWEKEDSVFEEIVLKKWSNIIFKSDDFIKNQNINPYQYKMIRGETFYHFCLGKINRNKNITALQGDISTMVSNDTETFIIVDGKKINADKIFSSILLEEPMLAPKDIYIHQHFKGWVIETPTPSFDANTATLMDFSVSQEHGATFVYVLPITPQKALVEYTLFTKQLLEQQQYDDSLQHYISHDLKIGNYTIAETEYGIIPMTNYRFTAAQHHIYFIGTAGAATKASSGYTFTFIQQQTQNIIEQLKLNQTINTSVTPARFAWYDSVLLHLMDKNQLTLKEIFTRLFQKNSMQYIFSFLNNASTLPQEIKMMTTLQIIQFAKAALQRL